MTGHAESMFRAATVAVGVLVVVVVATGGGPALAAGITVNTTADELNADGDCSLREAIQSANTDAAVDACTAGSGPDTITLPAGTFTISLAGTDEDANATGDFDILDDVTIGGAGAASTTVDGSALDRVFDVDPSATASTIDISGLTIQNGSTGSSGAGLRNRGTLTLTDSAFTGNDSVTGHGGAIQNAAPPADSLTMENVTITGNTANNGFGGGIDNRGPATLTNVTVSGNSAGGGGGIHDFGGTMTLIDSTVSGNTTPGQGGGIFLNSNSTLTIVGGTVDGNTSTDTGGGIQNEGDLTITDGSVSANTSGLITGGIHGESGSSLTMTGGSVTGNGPAGIILDPGSVATMTGVLVSANDGGGLNVSGTLTLTGSTVSENVTTGSGGGIDVSGGTVTVSGSTITGNSASDGAGIFSNGTVELVNSTISGNTATDSGGGMLNNVVADLTMTNVTVADNSPNGMQNFGAGTLTNTIVADGCGVPTALTSGGHNLDADGSCALGASGDATGDPSLDPLALNAPGATQTHALPVDSPAVDTGDDDACPAADQRGVSRPQDGDEDGTAICDVGAYELERPVPTPTPTPAPGEEEEEAESPSALPDTGGPAANGGWSPGLLAVVTALALAATGAGALGLARRRSR